MNYIVIGFLIGIGWHVVQLIYDVVYELLFCRLHKARWYNIAAGKRPIDIDAADNKKSVKNRIGF